MIGDPTNYKFKKKNGGGVNSAYNVITDTNEGSNSGSQGVQCSQFQYGINTNINSENMRSILHNLKAKNNSTQPTLQPCLHSGNTFTQEKNDRSLRC